ncbi:putative quinol monooxygenase [Cupriavidus sp. D384]|uniref:putative quinol monooxygenase n=1 Tax=Cupriavidus sp. D384 TaxID=1538095 RepID=UPI0009EED79F|nr:putative quinol monooxygenase [Cupriavidus sp. D384]
MPIIVSVKYRLKSGKRQELLSFVMDNVINTRNEPGNLAYSHYPSLEDEQEMFVYEMWEDMDSLNSHIHTDHYIRFANLRKPILESYESQAYESTLRRERSKAPWVD